MTDKEKDLIILQNKLQGYQEAAKRVEAEIKRHNDNAKKPFSYQKLDGELRLARAKHYKFCDVLLTSSLSLISRRLEALREMLANQVDTNMASAEVALICEVVELLEAVARGDYEDAQKELLQVMAVCIRFYEEIEKRKVQRNRKTCVQHMCSRNP